LITKSFVSLKQYAYFKKVKKEAVTEREKRKVAAKNIKSQTQRFNIDRLEKYMKINDELTKYRIFKALKFYVVKSKNRRRHTRVERKRYLIKKNAKFIREVFDSWRGLNMDKHLEQKHKINKVCETNYRKTINESFTAWAKMTKKLKMIRKIGKEVESCQISKSRSNAFEAWRRLLKINQIASVFQYHYKRKLAFRAFKTYLGHQEVKRALYHQ
jgi:hypothetical protein